MSEQESETAKREMAKIKTENRRLTTQLTHADRKLREYHHRSESRLSLASTRSSSSNSSLNAHPGRATRQECKI